MKKIIPENEIQSGPKQREQQRIDTYQRIYSAAMEEFSLSGFDNAQINRIVEAAGVARGTFYFHFPTKEHVLREMQRRVETNVMKRLDRLRSRPGSVRELLEKAIGVIMEEAGAIGDRGLLRDLLSMYVRQQIDLELSEEPLLGGLAQFFTDAAERGEIRSDLNPQELTIILGMLLFGLVLNSEASVEVRILTVKGVIDFFIRGIAP